MQCIKKVQSKFKIGVKTVTAARPGVREIFWLLLSYFFITVTSMLFKPNQF